MRPEFQFGGWVEVVCCQVVCPYACGRERSERGGTGRADSPGHGRYNEDEELAGFAVMIEDNLAVPFETTVLGVTVTVRKISQTESGIVAICVRGKHRQAIPILDLPLPDPPPQGAGWIAAYRHWAG